MKKYYEDEELNKAFICWLENSPEAPHSLNTQKFVDFSIKALERNQYDTIFIMKTLKETNPFIEKMEHLEVMYYHFIEAIETTYKILQERGLLKHKKDELDK